MELHHGSTGQRPADGDRPDPAVDATGVAVGSDVTATFSEAVSGVSTTTFQLRLATGGSALAATVTRNGTTNQWILNPIGTLQAGTHYTATLTGGTTAIRDSAGAALTTTSWSFTTAAPVNAPPTVTSRSPVVDATGVSTTSNVTATFSEAVSGVSATTFQLRLATGGSALAATVTRNGTTNQWILNPSSTLQAGTRYTATLTGGTTAIRDSAGAALTTTSWSFTTAAPVTTPPTVTSRVPGSSATNVSRTANLSATFSEAVSGVSTTTFQLRLASGGSAIAATVTRNGSTNQWILNPSSTLLARTQYRVTLTGGASAIRDTAGAPLTTTSWTFTTGS